MQATKMGDDFVFEDTEQEDVWELEARLAREPPAGVPVHVHRKQLTSTHQFLSPLFSG